MAGSDARPVALTAERIADCLALSSEAGWNQVGEDWRFMLAAGQSFGFAAPDETLVASGLTVDFPDYAWISMVLVTPRWRRQGLATRIMESCVEGLRNRGLVAALDASAEGQPVYMRLGFRPVGATTRLAGVLADAPELPGREVVPIAAADLPGIIAYDAHSSGTDRGALLSHLRQRLPAAGFVARANGRVCGYVMGRNGRLSAQLGPLVADDDAVALALLGRAGRAVGGRFCLDLFDQRTGIRDGLHRAGFAPLTRFVRMVHGAADIFPEPHRLYVIAGPELG